jgi:hypothetical protein
MKALEKTLELIPYSGRAKIEIARSYFLYFKIGDIVGPAWAKIAGINTETCNAQLGLGKFFYVGILAALHYKHVFGFFIKAYRRGGRSKQQVFQYLGRMLVRFGFLG